MTPWTDEAMALSYRLAIRLGQYEGSREEEKQMSVVEPGAGGEVPIIPNDLYTATITKVIDVVLEEADRFGNQEKVEIHLAFDVDGESMTLEPRVNRKWGEKATLYAIAEAAGLSPDPWAAFDTDALVKRKVNVLIETPEEGKWPRVKAWSKTRQTPAKGAQVAPVASDTPSMITALGVIDWTVFWAACKKAHIDQPEVADALGGDLTKLPEMEATKVVELFEILKGRHEGVAEPEDVPFSV